jgi:hypothetical protein
MIEVLEAHLVDIVVGQEYLLGTNVCVHKLLGMKNFSEGHNSQSEVNSFNFRKIGGSRLKLFKYLSVLFLTFPESFIKVIFKSSSRNFFNFSVNDLARDLAKAKDGGNLILIYLN